MYACIYGFSFQIDDVHPLNLTLFYSNMLHRVVEVFSIYRDAPVDSWDIEMLADNLLEVIPTFIRSTDTMHLGTALDYLTVIDILMDNDYRSFFSEAVNGYGEKYAIII